MTSTASKLSRGDVVLIPIAFVSGLGGKVRPAVVVQCDALNTKLNSTIVAIVTSVTKRAAVEPSQMLLDIATPDGKATGLLHESTVKAEHLDTVDQQDVVRVIGKFSPSLMRRLEACIHVSLGMP
jgi:mRNA interferase MazF